MRVPLSWLKEYVDIDMPAKELAEMLTIAGLEVEHLDYIGIPGAKDTDRLVWDREKLVLGHILRVDEHPNADRLVLATVDYGAAEPETVVTGAPNLFPYVGQGDLAGRLLYSPFALEGTTLYDGHQEGRIQMTLKGRKIRGIYNRCMLCSEKELGLSEEHEGILILQGAGYTPGTPLQDLLGDVVLEIDIIPNIARAASMVGVAREVAALTGRELRLPDVELVMTGPPVEGKVMISTDRPDLNPRFVAMVISGVEQKPSPYWMQHRLRLAGQRPINVVVDISNYVMLEMGQPNHTFDYNYLRRRADQYAGPDEPIHIHTRLPAEGETLTTLDGEKHDLPPFTILVTDPAGALSLGGIMGGLDSEISDHTDNVLLEAAAWNFINIRRSSHALRINSEAGFRFSRGVHPSQALFGAKRAAMLMQQLAGGTIHQGIVDYYPHPPVAEPIVLTTAEVRRIGGIEVTRPEIKAMLESLEFTVTEQEDHLLVTAPDHRIDIEGAHDLVEEVCRMYGYDRIPEGHMHDDLPPQRGNRPLELEMQVKDLLVQNGLQEIITYRMTTPEKENRILPATNGIRPDDRPYITLANPITVERVAMRHSLLASVLEIVALNSRFHDIIAVFELGHIYLAGEEGVLPDELRRLAIAMTGPRTPAGWHHDAPPLLDFFDLKGVLENLLEALHIGDWHVEATEHPTFRPGRTARLFIGEKQAGVLGEIHPLVVEGYALRLDNRNQAVLAAELNLDVMLAAVPADLRVKPVPTFPAVHEDLALIVDRNLPAADVAAAIEKAGGFLLKQVTLFDVYEGGQLPPGKKSLAYHLSFQAPNKTLKDRDVRKQRQRILQQLQRQLGAKLRE